MIDPLNTKCYNVLISTGLTSPLGPIETKTGGFLTATKLKRFPSAESFHADIDY